jgi:hypothetical protein
LDRIGIIAHTIGDKMNTIKVYTFDELDEGAQDRAVEDHAQFLSEAWEADWDLDYHKERLADMGFNDAKINFSGFYSQGDGASFEANVDILKFLEFKELKEKYPLVVRELEECGDTYLDIRRNAYSRYCHEQTMELADSEFSYSTYFGDYLEDAELENAYIAEYHKLCDKVLEIAKELAQDIYYSLRSDYEAQSEREYVIDSIRANEYTFFEDGKFCPY